VELVQEIQKRIGNTDPIELVPWARSYTELQTAPNVVLFSIARSKDRDPLFQWVGPIREATYQFYVRKDSPIVINSLEDARKLRLIGVYKDDVREQYLTGQGFTNLDRSIDNTIIVKKLMADRIDAFISTPDAVDLLLKTAGFSGRDVRGTFSFMKFQGYIAFSRTTPGSIVRKWGEAFEGIKKDGTYEKTFRKYFPNHPFAIPAAP
jgi:polar amino acid transport system substrate-binding protein